MRVFLIGFFCFSASYVAAQNQAVDTVKTVVLDNVVITASRLEEELAKSPVTVEKLNARQLLQSPAPSFFDALENVKGIQMLVPSLGFKVINTRGFGNTTNVRFVQLVDYHQTRWK